jgi:hypothetical protein
VGADLPVHLQVHNPSICWGVEDNPLAGRGESFGVIQRQGFALVENSQVVMGMAGDDDKAGGEHTSRPA